MRTLIRNSALALMLGAPLVLGGCATQEAVEHAQATADAAMSAAQHAQATADDAAKRADDAYNLAKGAHDRIDQMQARKGVKG